MEGGQGKRKKRKKKGTSVGIRNHFGGETIPCHSAEKGRNLLKTLKEPKKEGTREKSCYKKARPRGGSIPRRGKYSGSSKKASERMGSHRVERGTNGMIRVQGLSTG